MLAISAVGTRPNFIKMAPVVLELKRRNIPQLLVHTGQHYNANMSKIFFDELELPEPDIYLAIEADISTNQTAAIMVAFEKIYKKHKPDLIIVSGDVNSTLAIALAAAKHHIPIAHIESGLRSFDITMPEEVNRIGTDHLSSLLFTTEESANENLLREGIAIDYIHFVGNCMIDTLMKNIDKALQQSPWQIFGLEEYKYALLTLHRPSNVDFQEVLRLLIDTVGEISRHIPILFPIHPRTKERLVKWNIKMLPSIKLCEPLGYLNFLGLMARAKFVLTDSGGIQEETTALDVPCLTLRCNTERPITITNGTNRITGVDSAKIKKSIDEILSGNWPVAIKPPLWDGKTASRIVDVIENDKLERTMKSI